MNSKQLFVGHAARDAAALLITICALGCGSASDGSGVPFVGASSGAGGAASETDSGGGEIMSSEASVTPSVSGSSSGSLSGEPDEASTIVGPSSGPLEDAASIAETGPSPNDASPSSAGDSGLTGCSGGKTLVASDGQSSTKPAGDYGDVEFNVALTTQIVSMYTTLAVPAEPPPSGTLFLWPGLQPLPGGTDFNPIGEGVLQPVLTWGGTCAPGAPNDYTSWWISGQYVTNPSNIPGHSGCNGGAGMDVKVGDLLDIAMTLSGTVWTQVITDRQSGKSVSYPIDMLGQAQNWALFQIEVPDGRQPVSDVVFTSTKITFAAPDAAACQPSARGTNDYFSAPQLSSDEMSCCVSKIILRGQGVAATSPNTP